jgi:hypothetical protein
MYRTIFLMMTIVGLVLTGVTPARAQSVLAPGGISVSSGVFNYDLSGTGNTPAIAVAADWRLIGNWLLEAGLTAARPVQQFGDRTVFIIPEVQVQHEWTLGRLSPFAGGGIGAGIDFRDELFGGARTDLALSAGGGLRAALTDAMGLRGEFLLRGFGRDFSATAAEIRGGVYWRF